MTLPEIAAPLLHLGMSGVWLALGAAYAAVVGVLRLVGEYRDARAERGQR